MIQEHKKAIALVMLGIAIIAVPFILRHFQDKETARQLIPYEEDVDDEKNSKKEKDALFQEEGVIGIVKIPSLNIKLPIYEGANPEQLDKGIGHMSDTAPLCTKGNAVCAGHNGSRRGVFFTYLCNIEIGAKVVVINKDDVKHTYQAAEMKVVNPYDAWVTDESEEEVLTLFTCANHGTNRFVVKCVPVEEDTP
ncbi:MAG: class D sortase [Lachnospiraceae bacterium]|nr:class D sortase [Lachnospiraceae bacterium]